MPLVFTLKTVPPPEAPKPLLRQRSQSLIRLAIAGATIGAGALVGWLGSSLSAIGLFVIAIALCVPPPARRAWTSLQKRVFDINDLMVIAVVGAAALGDWFEAATVVWLFGVAQEIEWFSLERARHALLAHRAQAVHVYRGGQARRVPTSRASATRPIHVPARIPDP